MRVGILSRNPALYTTGRLAESAARRGHRTTVVDPLRCSLVLSRQTPEVFYRGLEGRLPRFDVLVPRIGASITDQGLAVVNQFAMMGVPLVNSAQPIARSRDKLRALQLLVRAGIDVPRTVMARDPRQVHRALEMVGGPPAVIKVLQGAQGIGVILAETEQVVLTVVETFASLGMNIMIQEFIEESEGRDLRALVVGGRVVAAMRRQARLGEFRSNVHRGGSSTAVELSPDYQRAALRATRAMGLQVAGVDLLESKHGPKLLEVNSSPGFEGLERATGADVAGAIIDYAIAFARRRAGQKEVG